MFYVLFCVFAVVNWGRSFRAYAFRYADRLPWIGGRLCVNPWLLARLICDPSKWYSDRGHTAHILPLAHGQAPMTDQHYTIAQVARLLAVSRFTVRRWITEGSLRAINATSQRDTGRAAWRVQESTLNAWLEERANVPQPTAGDSEPKQTPPKRRPLMPPPKQYV